MRFEFMTATKVGVGPGCTDTFPKGYAPLGARAWVVYGGRARARGGRVGALIERVLESVDVAGTLEIASEPDVPFIEAALERARAGGYDHVIGIGGGSVVDAAKALGALALNEAPLMEYLEVVGTGRPLAKPAVPIVAIPTTAGTGSEVTKNAVLTVPGHNVKASLRHPSLLPSLSLVDANLTLEMPPQVTAFSGLDALSQLLEGYVSVKAQPITDGLCLSGLSLGANALRRAYASPQDLSAREAMCTASLLSGMVLANAGLGAIHGIAAPLGGAFHVPHGAACAALLPEVTRVNLLALKRSRGPALRRYQQAASFFLPPEQAAAPDWDTHFVTALERLVRDLEVPRLSSYGLLKEDLPSLAQKALNASSTKGNPVMLSEEEMFGVLLASL